MGPFTMMGKLFNTVGTMIEVVDDTATGTKKLVNDGFEMIDEAVSGVKQDLKADNVIANAERQIKISQAEAKAQEMLTVLQQPTKSE